MARTIALIDYGSGNLRSAEKALARANAESGSDFTVVVTNDPETVRHSERVVLPGVGAFADCMRGLSAVGGMIEVLDATVVRGGKPFLGICVGMQLMARVGREFGETPGLGWIDGEVVHLAPHDSALKIPHMGWNGLHIAEPHPIFENISEDAHAYFVHSFEFRSRANILATTDYGGAVTAVIGRDNLVGTQFHPEKSQAVGLRLLANFLRWQP